MIKRIKSFGIIVGSMALTAFVAVLPTVEFANFVGWLKEVVTGWGVPTVVWAVVSAFLAQLWFAWRNKVIKDKATNGTLGGRKSFVDYENELY